RGKRALLARGDACLRPVNCFHEAPFRSMAIFELVIALLLVGAVLALWADKIGVPYPALLALAGAALALIPGTPQVMLDPELALALFVAPVLLDAAYDASPRDLKQNLIAVSSLALLVVGVTIAAVAVIARLFVLTCGGGVVLGVVLARFYMWLTTHVDDIPIWVLLQFIGTFAVWMLADRLGLSAIITVISYAMTLARRAPMRSDARHRISSYAVWDVAVFVLNVLAFVLIGLQLRGILTRMRGSDWHTYLMCALGV